jgi:thioesterase domain-containing protein
MVENASDRYTVWDRHKRVLGAETRFFTPEAAFALALRVYKPQPYSGSAISFRRRSWGFDNFEISGGWARYISGKLEQQDISGDHNDIFREPHVGDLARQLMQALQAASSA